MKKLRLNYERFFAAYLLSHKSMIAILIMAFQTLQLQATSIEQAEVSFVKDEVSVKDVLKEIERQSNFRFFFNNQVDVTRKVSVRFERVPLLNAVKEIFLGTKVSYRVSGNQIILWRTDLGESIDPVDPSQLITMPMAPRSLTGKILDETGSPLPGVSILVKGTSNGTITDGDGQFRIDVDDDAILQVSSVGYRTAEIIVGTRTSIEHRMELDVTQLSEVVVTGYATEQKKDIIGSVTVVNTQDLLSAPSANMANQLQGRAAGVTVSNSGSLDGSAKVRIRGFGSFGGADPLYVIDGVPASSTSGIVRGAADNLNPNDIESMQVLKDAAAASIYGARAANGVVIITTKKGKAGNAKIGFDSYYGINYVPEQKLPQLLNTQEYGELLWRSYRGAGLKPGDSGWGSEIYGRGENPVIPEYILARETVNGSLITRGGTDLEALRISDPAKFASLVDPANYDFLTHQIVRSSDTNWFKEAFGTAPVQNYQISASGGSNQGNYALSLNMFDQKKVDTEAAYFTRYTLRANSSFNILKKVRLGENLQISYTKNNAGDSGTNGQLNTLQPIIPVYDIMGNPASTAAKGTGNPRNTITERIRQNEGDRNYGYAIFGNVYAEADILKGLVARTSLGFDYSYGYQSNLTQRTYEHSENTPASNLTINSNNSTSLTWSNTLSYAKTFADKHSFKILVGTEAILTHSENLQGFRSGYELPPLGVDIDFITLATGVATTQTNTSSFGKTNLYSLFTRADYSFNDKYLINGTVRRDGSSKFGINNRIGYFPAVGLGWRLSSEEFMKGISWLDDLKLRGSWGIIGNQNGLPADNQYLILQADINQSYAITGSNSASSPSYTVNRLGNPDARWEKLITTNVGLDATLFNNSLDISAEYFEKTTSDLLVQYQAPTTSTTAMQPSVNVGTVLNKGFELNIGKKGEIVEGLRYDANVTFTRYKNIVEQVLDGPESFLSSGNNRTQSGFPMSYFYGYTIDGFFNTQEEVDAYKATTTTWLPPAIGRWRIVDRNGDNRVNDQDRGFMGSPHPTFQMGFNLSLSYKNFDLSTFWFWNQGGLIFNQVHTVNDFNVQQHNRSKIMLYESWTPELGDRAKLPKLDINDTFSGSNTTNWPLETGSYVRMKTLQLGYTFPSSKLARLKMDKLRIYVQAQNLLTLTKFTGMDPDGALAGSDLGMGSLNVQTPTPTQILGGVSLGF